MPKLKMFVWNGVHTDYTDGIVCVLAHSKKDAYEVMLKKDKDPEVKPWQGWWTITYEETRDREPDQVFETPDGAGVSGGG